MTLPAPQPGLVIRYEFLWRHERAEGLDYGRKGRPCAVIVAIEMGGGAIEAIVAPITHMAPVGSVEGIEIPPRVKAHLGLDAESAWVVVTDLNRFLWPGFDISPVPGSDPPRYAYGMLPPRLFERIKQRILDGDAELKAATPRD